MKTLEWQTLESRRKSNRLSMFYKATHGKAVVNIPSYVSIATHNLLAAVCKQHMDSLLIDLLLIFVLIHKYTTFKLKADLSPVNCNTQVLSTSQYETVQLVLKRNGSQHFPDINGCYYSIKLKSYYGNRFKKLVVTVSMDILNDCQYVIEIYTGDPTINRYIKTLNCDSDPTWIGSYPTKDIFLRYVHSTREDVNVTEDVSDMLLTNVSFNLCTKCFETPKVFSVREQITDYCGQQVCLGDKDLLYVNDRYSASISDFLPGKYSSRRLSICPYCRRIQFMVKDSIQLCLKAYAGTTVWSEGKDCRVTLDIDGSTALTLNSELRWTWCLPWDLKGKTVKFTFGVDSGWDCAISSDRCAVEIQIVSLNKTAQLCQTTTPKPKEWPTTTQSYQWSSWNSNNDGVDNDDSSSDSDESSRFPIVILCTVGGVVGMTICGTCCKNLYSSSSTRRDENYLNQEINMQRPQNGFFTRRSNEPSETQNMLHSQIIEPESTALDPSAPPVYDSVTIPAEETYTSASGDNTPDNIPLPSTVENRDSPDSNLSNRPPIVAAPPSYEEACQYYQLT
ncbi:unnamed protein product [Mytilus coruscus]|uniref:Uncharacterized protein n=1 Tax=Mytilus coruscus TaxID=42192 RepID=A0A6J8EJE4_MYTCO|nr:unnamed protein product [Mytilus coruscus]